MSNSATDKIARERLSIAEREALDVLVHEAVSDMAIHAIASNEQIEFLLANGFSSNDIRQRLDEMVLPDDQGPAIRGCSCGLADFAAPGHDGDPSTSGHSRSRK